MPQSSVAVPVVQQGLTIDQGAEIRGNLEYTQNSELTFPAGVVAGPRDTAGPARRHGRGARVPTAGERAGQWALQSLRSLVTLILIGLLLLLADPGLHAGAYCAN